MSELIPNTSGARRLLKPAEVSEWTRLEVKTLANLRLSGNGPTYHKVGRLVVYAEADVRAWLDANRRNSTSDIGDAAGR